MSYNSPQSFEGLHFGNLQPNLLPEQGIDLSNELSLESFSKEVSDFYKVTLTSTISFFQQ